MWYILFNCCHNYPEGSAEDEALCRQRTVDNPHWPYCSEGSAEGEAFARWQGTTVVGIMPTPKGSAEGEALCRGVGPTHLGDATADSHITLLLSSAAGGM